MCPWEFLPPEPYTYCEAQRCAWVVEPANTWSNVGYLVVALLVLSSRRRAPHPRDLPFFVAISCLAVGSTAMHLTGSHLGKLLDVGSMLVLSTLLLSLGLRSVLRLSEMTHRALFLAGTLASWVYLALMGFGSPLFAAQLCGAVVLGWVAVRRENPRLQLLGAAIVVLALAYLAWTLDRRRILCNPQNHIVSGHAVWHLLCAASIWLVYKFHGTARVA